MNISVPFAASVFVPCSTSRSVEDVLLSGDLHASVTITANNSNAHITILANPEGISGTGVVRGDAYQSTGVTRDDMNIRSGALFNETFVNNFRILGPGARESRE